MVEGNWKSENILNTWSSKVQILSKWFIDCKAAHILRRFDFSAFLKVHILLSLGIFDIFIWTQVWAFHSFNVRPIVIQEEFFCLVNNHTTKPYQKHFQLINSRHKLALHQNKNLLEKFSPCYDESHMFHASIQQQQQQHLNTLVLLWGKVSFCAQYFTVNTLSRKKSEKCLFVSYVVVKGMVCSNMFPVQIR